MRTELVSASVGAPGKQSGLVRVDKASLLPRIADQRRRLLMDSSYADVISSLQEGDDAELAGLQGIMRVGNAYRAIDRIRVTDMLNRRRHRIDMIV
jgi:hypothetical protein